MDALSEILRGIQLSGSAFIDAELSAPWAVQTPSAVEIARRFAPDAGRIIPYHVVVEGACMVGIGAHAPVVVDAGEVICFPHGDVHLLASDSGLKPTRITTDAMVTLTRPDAVSRVKFGGTGETTRLICGFFACDHTLSQHLVKPLPRLLRYKIEADSAATLLPSAVRAERMSSMRNARPGTKAILCKMSELLFVEVVRSYVETLADHGGGWLAGLKDAQISDALALMHGDPREEWTLELLAKRVGMSRSALTDRFVRVIGQPPVQYLSQWRLRLAAHSLSSTDRAIKKIASEARFGSTAAFCRAFKREFGDSPVRWRRSGRTTAQSPAADV